MTITVDYEDERGSMSYDDMVRDAKVLLDSAANSLAANGLLSDDSSMNVESWDSEVSCIVKKN